MQTLRKNQKKTQVIKYTLLLIVGCIVFLVLFSIFMVDSKLNDNLISHAEKEQTYRLKDDCSLSINSSILEGVNNDFPYRIEAKNIVKDRSNNYILEGVSCKYSMNRGDIIIDSQKGFLDEITKKLFLNEEVKLVFNDMRLRSSDLHLDINTNDLKSDKPTIIDFKNSYIKANQVETKNSTDIIKFKGGVKTVFDINDF